MVKFGTGLALVCLQFYFLTGLSARRPYCKCTHIPLAPPSNPNHPFYKAFRKVPSARVTANKFVKNFLHLSRSSVTKRQTYVEDVVAVLDGSGSIGSCEFQKGKTALSYLMGAAMEANPRVDTKYAAVTFASSATVNFKFLKYSAAASKIMTIRYPGGMTNTQAGLNEALKLFRNTGSGVRHFGRKAVLLITDGQSTFYRHLTIPKAHDLKKNGVEISVIAVGGAFMAGIDEMVKIASWPPEKYLFRVSDLSGLVDVIKLVEKQVAPRNYYRFIYAQPNKPCHYHG